MKQKIRDLVLKAASLAYEKGDLPSSDFPDIEIDVPKFENQGDFATNFAMLMASVQKMPPRKIAETIKAHLQDPEGILARVEIAGPGFINFFINPSTWHAVLKKIHQADSSYGATDLGKGKNIQVEFPAGTS